MKAYSTIWFQIDVVTHRLKPELSVWLKNLRIIHYHFEDENFSV